VYDYSVFWEFSASDETMAKLGHVTIHEKHVFTLTGKRPYDKISFLQKIIPHFVSVYTYIGIRRCTLGFSALVLVDGWLQSPHNDLEYTPGIFRFRETIESS